MMKRFILFWVDKTVFLKPLARAFASTSLAVALGGLMLLTGWITMTAQSAHAAGRYDFDGAIDQDVLENYLARSIQYLGLCAEAPSRAPFFEDSLRMIRRLRPKFIGRAAYAWDVPADDPAHFAQAAQSAREIHAIDPQIILQACVFETAYSAYSPQTPQRVAMGYPACGVETVAVPAWVLEAFGQPVQERNFSYEAMLYPDGHWRDLWLPGASVPDISQLETRMWFYYRACSYIDAGYESIHFGQVLLMDDNDPDWALWDGLLAMVRAYATTHARRHYVLCDAHLVDQGVVRQGRLLWDFIGYPLRVVEGVEPLEGHLEAGHIDALYGRAPGGRHPSGWDCPVVPQLYEIDNCSSQISDDNEFWIWGCDEATWFANLKPARRDAFLRDAWDWIWTRVPHGYFEMPGRRPAHVPINQPRVYSYIANDRSEQCPDGFGQESVIANIWDDPAYANPMRRQTTPPAPVQASGAAATATLPSDEQGPVALWNFDVPPGEPETLSLPSAGPIPVAAHLKRCYTARELKALYRVYGDQNAPEQVELGREELSVMRSGMDQIFGEAPAGRSVCFNGFYYLDFGAHPALGSAQMSVAFWLKAQAQATGEVILGKANWMQHDYRVTRCAQDASFYVELREENGAERKALIGTLPDGQWRHVAFTVDGENLKTYLDGALVQSVASGAVRVSDSPLLAGRCCTGMAVADVRCYQHALNGGQIAGLLNP